MGGWEKLIELGKVQYGELSNYKQRWIFKSTSLLCKCRVYGVVHYKTTVLINTNEMSSSITLLNNSACICKGMTKAGRIYEFGGVGGGLNLCKMEHNRTVDYVLWAHRRTVGQSVNQR